MTEASNIIALHGGITHPSAQAEPSSEVIAGLEEMLERAKAGRLSGFTIIGEDAEQGAFHASVGFVGSFAKIGALEGAKLFLFDMQGDED